MAKSLPNKISRAITENGNPVIINETACDISNSVITSYLNHGINQETKFCVRLKDMTYSHYMEQPKSMVCHKKIGFFEVKREYVNDFEYNWLPGCLRVNK